MDRVPRYNWRGVSPTDSDGSSNNIERSHCSMRQLPREISINASDLPLGASRGGDICAASTRLPAVPEVVDEESLHTAMLATRAPPRSSMVTSDESLSIVTDAPLPTISTS